jgi:hypothetical protein
MFDVILSKNIPNFEANHTLARGPRHSGITAQLCCRKKSKAEALSSDFEE